MYPSRFPFVPWHFADETLFSWSAAFGRLSGCASSAETSQLLFGHKSSGLNFSFPSGLKSLAMNMAVVYPSPSAWARRTTLLPYLTKFASPDLFDRAVDALSHTNSGGTLRPLLGLTGQVGQRQLQVRACASCLKSDRDSHGRPIWRRSHLLPGVTMCVVHSEPLHSVVGMGPGRQRQFFGPSDTLELAPLAEVERSDPAPRVRFARLSTWLLESENKYCDPEILRLTYLHGLRDAGFVTHAGRLRRAQLRAAIAEHLSAIGLDSQLQGVSPSALAIGVALGSRRAQQHATAWSHAILIDFLFGSWERFNSIYEWETRFLMPTEVSSDNSRPQYSSCNWDEGCGTYSD
jgi:hypothetical protein